MKRSVGLLIAALVVTMSVAGSALAEDGGDDPAVAIVTPEIIVDLENGTIVIALPVDGELPECSVEDGGDELVDDAVVGDPDDESEDASYGPGDCIEFMLDHPSGKTHHGAVVSTVAKNLHPSMLQGIKKGEIMRYIANTPKPADGGEAGDAERKGDAGNDKTERKAEKAERKAEKKAAKAARKAAHKADKGTKSNSRR